MFCALRGVRHATDTRSAKFPGTLAAVVFDSLRLALREQLAYLFSGSICPCGRVQILGLALKVLYDQRPIRREIGVVIEKFLLKLLGVVFLSARLLALLNHGTGLACGLLSHDAFEVLEGLGRVGDELIKETVVHFLVRGGHLRSRCFLGEFALGLGLSLDSSSELLLALCELLNALTDLILKFLEVAWNFLGVLFICH
jgi:hypothetical protein